MKIDWKGGGDPKVEVNVYDKECRKLLKKKNVKFKCHSFEDIIKILLLHLNVMADKNFSFKKCDS